MRRWWKAFAVLAGGLLYLSGFLASAAAQGPLSGLFQKPPQPEKKIDAAEMFTLPNGPNAWSNEVERQRNYAPSLRTPTLRPGIFWPVITPAVPAEFPNPACASNEPMSPWEVRQEGAPNAFTDYVDPQPRPMMHLLHGQRRLISEMLEPAPQVMPSWMVSFSGEFLYWRPTPGPSRIPLVTTTTAPSVLNFGQLGNSNTILLAPGGDAAFDYNYMNGFRLGATVTLPSLPGVSLSGFSFNQTATAAAGGSLTSPTQLLAIPFQDMRFPVAGFTNIGTESTFVIALPPGAPLGPRGGDVSITSEMDFSNINADILFPMPPSDVFQLTFMIGYRRMELNESLRLRTTQGRVGNIVFQGLPIVPQGQFIASTLDTFRTTNAFDGGNVGARTVFTFGRFSLYSDTKAAVGAQRSSITVNGSSTLTNLIDQSQSRSANGGILALPTNSGAASLPLANFIGESTTALSYQVNANIRAFVGYNLLYWFAVGRPGDFLNRQLDPRQIPTDPRFQANVSYIAPIPLGPTRREFLAQGLFAGIEFGF